MTWPTTSYQLSFRSSSSSSSTWPPWLQAALAEIEERVSAVTQSDSAASDSFADLAEFYYEKRPQLLALLHDLYHRYLHLADRYSQSLLRRATSSPPDSPTSSAAESSISFQPITTGPGPGPVDLDFIVAELVSSMVEKDLLITENVESHRYRAEAERRMGLQCSLLEVLESEREVLAGENARLVYKAAAAEAEARGLAVEVGWMRRRAGELARAVVKLREDHRVCLLGWRIEGLQAQIYALERRNRECCEAMKRREEEKGAERVELDRLREENRRLRKKAGQGSGRRRWERVGKLLAPARRPEWGPCVPEVEKAPGCYCW